MIVYIGTYTFKRSEGIYRCEFDPETGDLGNPELVAYSENPSYLCIHPSGDFLYAVNETREGTVSAFAIDSATGDLSRINSVSSRGSAPCHVSIDATGSLLLVANYGSGTVSVCPVREDGGLAEPTCTIQHEGKGTHPRQEAPHAHFITPDPSNRFALSVDLGINRVRVYRIDLKQQALLPHSEIVLHAESGPRHLAFHPNGKLVCVANELDSTISVLSWDGDSGTLEQRSVCSMLPDGFQGKSTAAAIRISSCGRFVYASNRGHESIFVGEIDPETGEITPKDWINVRGSSPRDFAIDPTGKWILVSNQNSDNVVKFAVKGDGSLESNGDEVDISLPVCVCYCEV